MKYLKDNRGFLLITDCDHVFAYLRGWDFLPDCNYEAWLERWGGSTDPANDIDVSRLEWLIQGIPPFNIKEAELHCDYRSDSEYTPSISFPPSPGSLGKKETLKNLKWFFNELGETEEEYWHRWDGIHFDHTLKDPGNYKKLYKAMFKDVDPYDINTEIIEWHQVTSAYCAMDDYPKDSPEWNLLSEKIFKFTGRRV